MDYIILEVPPGKGDELGEKLLELAAMSSSGGTHAFETPVEPQLSAGLSPLEFYQPSAGMGRDFLPVRLYQREEGESERLLLVGENISLDLRGILGIVADNVSRRGCYGQEGNPPPDEGWFLVGMALPGWLLYFDPDAESVEKAAYNQGLTVLNLPAAQGCALEALSPSVPAKTALEVLLRHILSLLGS